MKKLMVLGASQPQARLIRAAKELGYYTIAVSIPGNYPGLALADKVLDIDICDKEAVLEAAKREEIDGVATCCFDLPLEALGHVNSNLNLKGLSERSSMLSSDKLLMKRAFEEKGVRTARFRNLQSRDDLTQALKELAFPMIIKAVDLAGSRGIYKVLDEAQAYEFYDQVMQETGKDYCMIEEFIEGEDFGAQAFVQNGKIIFTLPHGDYTYFDHTAMPIGHFAPIELGEAFNEDVIRECEKAIRAIELDNCAVNIDLIEKDGKPYLIELTGRAGATCCVEMVSIYYGIDYYKMIAKVAVGDPVDELFASRAKVPTPNASHFFMNFTEGTLKEIVNKNDPEDPMIYELTFDVEPGEPIHVYKNSKNKVGQVVVQGETLKACQDKIEEVLKNVEIIVNPAEQ